MRDTLLYAASAISLLSLVRFPASAQRGPAPDESAPSKPTPRWTDGRPDLGNAKGAWFPQIVDDISGNGGGEKDPRTRERQMKMVDERVDVPFLPWAKKVYDERAATLSKEDPVETGDRITIDAERNVLDVDLPHEELAARRNRWKMPPYKATRGTLAKYIRLVSDASHGCVTDE